MDPIRIELNLICLMNLISSTQRSRICIWPSKFKYLDHCKKVMMLYPYHTFYCHVDHMNTTGWSTFNNEAEKVVSEFVQCCYRHVTRGRGFEQWYDCLVHRTAQGCSSIGWEGKEGRLCARYHCLQYNAESQAGGRSVMGWTCTAFLSAWWVVVNGLLRFQNYTTVVTSLLKFSQVLEKIIPIKQ